MSIQYVPYKNIDKAKWDQCIRRAENGLIYAESVYLDHMSPNWDAIILDDYAAVLPLTWKKKLGIKYLYQPAFFQQGGIISSLPVTPGMLNSFIQLAATKFRFAEITLNFLNIPGKGKNIFTSSLRNNFILPLNRDYKTIHSHFHSDVKQSLKKTVKSSLEYKKSVQYNDAIELYQRSYGSRFNISSREYVQFKSLCAYYLEHKRLLVREVYEGTELMAVALLLKDKNRLYNIISCITSKGKRLLANYFLYNELIREFATKDMVLDFEGSDLPGVAFFYRKFTNVNQQYPFIRYNLLPAPLKLLKP